MTTESSTQWEVRLQEIAGTLAYPPTPDIDSAVQARLFKQAEERKAPFTRRPRLRWAVVVLLVLVLLAGGLMAVPGVRAAVIELIRVGAIQIFLPQPTPQPAEDQAGAMMPPTATPASAGTAPAAHNPPTITAVALSERLFDPADAVDLAAAGAAVSFPIKLPAYPPGLGEPDAVFIHDAVWPPTVVLVWREPGGDDAPVQMSLYQIGADKYAYKGANMVEETTVLDQRAFWLQGPHYFRLENGDIQPWLFVEDNVLVWWSADGVTYRLESHLTLAEARQVAESLQPLEE